MKVKLDLTVQEADKALGVSVKAQWTTAEIGIGIVLVSEYSKDFTP